MGPKVRIREPLQGPCIYYTDLYSYMDSLSQKSKQLFFRRHCSGPPWFSLRSTCTITLGPCTIREFPELKVLSLSVLRMTALLSGVYILAPDFRNLDIRLYSQEGTWTICPFKGHVVLKVLSVRETRHLQNAGRGKCTSFCRRSRRQNTQQSAAWMQEPLARR